MVLGWRRRKTCQSLKGRKPVLELVVPDHFRCPISLDLMKDPVTLSTGITYDRQNIEKWFEQGNYICPVTNQILNNFDLIPNHTLRIMIQDWCVENKKHGVERIPTPRIPITPIQVSEVLVRLKALTRRVDQYGCLELVQRIERWGEESERNRRCLMENGVCGVLAYVFEAFARDSVERNACVLEEILSALDWMSPFDKEGQRILGSGVSLSCLVWFLKQQDLSRKQKSMAVLKEVVSCGDEKSMESLAGIEGVKELLMEFISNRICPTITKASLLLTFHLVSSSSSPSIHKMKLGLMEMGLVSCLLEILIDSEKSLCEKALSVFDTLCSCEEGREKAYANALTIPILVKKILRVSELATDSSVSAIWNLCKFGRKDEGRVLVEALQVGAFQKLLLILQVGCGDETKEKATELLKLLNLYRAGLECIESVDFKNLKRSF